MPSSQEKSFLLTALALAPSVWIISFNYGVYKTIFYEHLFVIWAISIAALISSFVIKLDDEAISFSTLKGRLLLLLPSVWVLSGYWAHMGEYSNSIYWLDIILTLLTLFLSMPYILYYVVLVLVPSAQSIYSSKLLGMLVVITILIAVLGFLVGHFHPQFLYCETFEIAGNKLPENCWPKPLE